MSNFQVSQLEPAAATEPLELPINALIALPEYKTGRRYAPFNMPAAIIKLLGRFGWERATKILNTHVWAPDWVDHQLQNFIEAESPQHEFPGVNPPLQSLRAPHFPGSGPLADPHSLNYPQYQIVHFVGRVERRNWEYALDLGYNFSRVLVARSLRDKFEEAKMQTLALLGRGSSKSHLLGTTALQAALVAAGTRLLILQVSVNQSFDAEQLAKSVVHGGVPAALTVSGDDTRTVNDYFLNFYANIIHNNTLTEAARPQPQMERLTVHLIYRRGGEDLLQLNRWIDSLDKRLKKANKTAKHLKERLDILHEGKKPFLHLLQLEAVENSKGIVKDLTDHISSEANNLTAIQREMQWQHESEGAVPLSQTADYIPNIERKISELERIYPQLSQELQNEAARAPRVLNANFASYDGHILEASEGLVAGLEYDLLVDVGPRWSRIKSIVTGKDAFPERALPPDDNGYVIEVVVLSDDFSPRLNSARMWVPNRSGRSYPIKDGQKAPMRGPVAIRLQAPEFDTNNKATVATARARLCLYYENNLLQSALIQVGVLPLAGDLLEKENTIEVDFVLTSGFQQVTKRFATRAVKFLPNEAGTGHPIAVNLTLNDDGNGRHRIIVKSRDATEIGWVQYVPSANELLLTQARATLLDCFGQRDLNTGNVLKNPGLKMDNGKDRNQFKWDLLKLATLGDRLFNIIFVPMTEGAAVISWRDDFEASLKDPSLIQVARTGPANYVFPWALVYEHPLPDPNKYAFCDIVVEEWGEDGKRRNPTDRKYCKYKDHARHKKNILCPYGFWGLKHIIEQPPSALHKLNGTYELNDVPDKIVTGESFRLAIGVTRDLGFSDLKTITKHLDELRNIRHVHFDPDKPADDLDKVRAALKAPEVVYFLCHGEYDKTTVPNEPYLGVGLRNSQPPPKIYPNTLIGWTRARDFERDGWMKHRPLIFINGCHTCDLKPSEILNFVTAFTHAGASGIIGTEISVQLPLAAEVAMSLFTKIARQESLSQESLSIGEAIRRIRWELANKGNLLGLAYTPYCLSDLRIVSNSEGSTVPN